MVVYGVWPYQMGLLGAINVCTIEIFPDYTLSLLSLVNPLYAKVVFALFWPLGKDMGYLKLKEFFQYSN